MFPGEIYLLDCSVEATTRPQQLRDLWWNGTWHLVGEVTQFRFGETRKKLQDDDPAIFVDERVRLGSPDDLKRSHKQSLQARRRPYTIILVRQASPNDLSRGLRNTTGVLRGVCTAQRLRMKDSKNPAAVAIEFNGRPCSKASGMRVSASEARTAPPAKASGKARCSSGNWANTPRPNTTAKVSSTAVSNQIPIAKGAERPPRRIATAHKSDSGKFEQKIATSNVRLPPPESKETPSARFSGTPSKDPAARSAKPIAALPACWVAVSCTRSVCCASAPETSSAASEERAGTSWGSPALWATHESRAVLMTTKVSPPAINPSPAGHRPPRWTASGNSSKVSAEISVPLAKASSTPLIWYGARQ